MPLFRIYDHCIRQGRAGNFAAVRATSSNSGRLEPVRASARIERNPSHRDEAELALAGESGQMALSRNFTCLHQLLSA